MYKVITRQEELCELINASIKSLRALENTKVNEKLTCLIQCLNVYYGKERDLEKDLGGYIVLVYGDLEDIKRTRERILAYHHFGTEDYEFEDIFDVTEHSTVVTFQLFLCSSDYSVEIVTFEGDK